MAGVEKIKIIKSENFSSIYMQLLSIIITSALKLNLKILDSKLLKLIIINPSLLNTWELIFKTV